MNGLAARVGFVAGLLAAILCLAASSQVSRTHGEACPVDCTVCGEAIERGWQYLVSIQRANGAWGTRDGPSMPYSIAAGSALVALPLHQGHLWAAAAPRPAPPPGRWSRLESGTRAPLLGIGFANARVGWAVGAEGTILRTADGGRTWSAQPGGTRGTLMDVHPVDERTAWAAGALGRSALVLRTKDGGAHWVASRPGAFPAAAIHARSRDAAWLASYGGSPLPWRTAGALHPDGDVAWTRDGGRRWRLQHSGPQAACRALFDITFVEERWGWAVGSQPLCVKSEQCLLGKRSGAVVHTADGGRTWEVQRTPMPACVVRSVAAGSPAAAAGLRKGDVILALEGKKVADYIDFKVARWPDLSSVLGGESRGPLRLQVRRHGKVIALEIPAPGARFDCKPSVPLLFGVAFADRRTGWTVGERGTILHTTDGGRTWRPQPSGTERTLRGVDFVDRGTGWIVGDGGTILHTTDGGRHWVREASPTSEDLYRVDFVDATRGFAVGTRGTLLSYEARPARKPGGHPRQAEAREPPAPRSPVPAREALPDRRRSGPPRSVPRPLLPGARVPERRRRSVVGVQGLLLPEHRGGTRVEEGRFQGWSGKEPEFVGGWTPVESLAALSSIVLSLESSKLSFVARFRRK